MRLFGLAQRKNARELAVVFGGNVCAGISILGGLKLLTRYLAPNHYGEYVLALSGAVFAIQLLYGPLAAAAMRFMPDAGRNSQSDRCYTAVVELTRRYSIYLASACVGIAVLTALLNASYIVLVCAGSVSAIAGGTVNVLEACLSAERRRIAAALSSGLGQLARNGCAVIGAATGSANLAVVGYAAATLVQLLLLLNITSKLWKKRPFAANPEVARYDWSSELVRYAGPFFIWGVPMALYAVADRWSLQLIIGESSVGIYAAALQLVQQPVNFVFSGFFLFISPRVFAAAGEGQATVPEKIGRQIQSGTVRMLVVGGLCFAGIATGGRALLPLFANDSYLSASYLLAPIFLSAFLYQVGQWGAFYQLVLKRSSRLMWPKCLTAIAGVLIFPIGAWAAGAAGVAWCGVGIAGVYACWVQLDGRKLCHSAEQGVPP